MSVGCENSLSKTRRIKHSANKNIEKICEGNAITILTLNKETKM